MSMTKEEKAEYDKEYRLKNKEMIRLKKAKYYQEHKDALYKKQRKRKDNDEQRARHAEYCRRPDQREKEKLRRHIRDNNTGTKHCIICNQTKHVLEFQNWRISPDKRSYICKCCEKQHQKEYGVTTRSIVNTMVNRRYTNLTRRDIAKHPYLIEANKFLILLKQLTK